MYSLVQFAVLVYDLFVLGQMFLLDCEQTAARFKLAVDQQTFIPALTTVVRFIRRIVTYSLSSIQPRQPPRRRHDVLCVVTRPFKAKRAFRAKPQRPKHAQTRFVNSTLTQGAQVSEAGSLEQYR